MNRISSFKAGAIAALGALVLTAVEAAAVPLTLSLSQQESYVGITGAFIHPLAGAIPFAPQDGLAGTTDYDAAHPSTWTTFQGTINVDVDNLLAPTSIKIVSSAADADFSGNWLHEVCV